jgi:hypothetical protein
MLHSLCPPLEAVGIGGSVGAGTRDSGSDLDFFLLVPDDGFFAIVREFPDLIRHPWPPLVMRRRGFHPEFGYMFSYAYHNRYQVDYNVNCRSSLIRTPMAAKIRVTKDLAGFFTRYQSDMRRYSAGHDESPALEAAAEFLLETLRIEKYAQRRELLSMVHRFERLRLILLGLERHLRRGEPYSPHDADKWAARDLTAETLREVEATFGPFTWEAAAKAFERLWLGVAERISDAAVGADLGVAYWSTCSETRAKIAEALTAATREA